MTPAIGRSSGDPVILAGDVGGTNTRLAWFEVAGAPDAGRDATYPSQQHTSLEEIVATFLREAPGKLAHVCIGVAGPVHEGRVEATNLPWTWTGPARPPAGPRRVILINDLEANAWGLAALPDTDFSRPPARAGGAEGERGGDLRGDRPRRGRARLGRSAPPADRLGGRSLRLGASERAASRALALPHGRGRARERGASALGTGLHNIYRFLRDGQGLAEPAWLAELLRSEAPAPVIGRVGLEGRAEICVRALELFVAIYGAEAGNLGLRVLATAGVYLGGGIAPGCCRRSRAGPSSTRSPPRDDCVRSSRRSRSASS